MALHHVYVSDLSAFSQAQAIDISGDEAHHAVRVKRLEVGDVLTLVDGKGRTLEGPISGVTKDRRTDGWRITIDASAGIRSVARPASILTVFAAAPKGDRLDEMIDGLSQVGVAKWHPLLSKRSVVDPRPTKLDRLQRVALESMKQCGRAWVLEIGEPVAITRVPMGRDTVVADGSGGPFTPGSIPSSGPSSLLIGPEGGLAPEELAALRAAGCVVLAFGPHIMRVETAAVVAAAFVTARG